MLTDEQLKKIISANESLQVQLADVNTILALREQEIEILQAELDDTTALRSKLTGQLGEIESIQHALDKKQQAARGAEEREIELHQELSGMAGLNKDYNELMQDYAYLQSQYKDVLAQLSVLNERNSNLQLIAGRIGELESKLENITQERDNLKGRISILETQKLMKEL